MDIKPVMDNVLVKVDVVPARSPGGLLLPGVNPVAKNSGVVVAVGDSEVIRVRPGDRVLFDKGMGRRFDVPEVTETASMRVVERHEHILIPYFEIAAVVEEG